MKPQFDPTWHQFFEASAYPQMFSERHGFYLPIMRMWVKPLELDPNELAGQNWTKEQVWGRQQMTAGQQMAFWGNIDPILFVPVAGPLPLLTKALPDVDDPKLFYGLGLLSYWDVLDQPCHCPAGLRAEPGPLQKGKLYVRIPHWAPDQNEQSDLNGRLEKEKPQ